MQLRNLLFAATLISLSACQSDYNRPVREGLTSTPPADPTGSAAYQQPGAAPSAGFDTAAPNKPTGSAKYQGSGRGQPDTLTASPPANPTGSAGYQR